MDLDEMLIHSVANLWLCVIRSMSMVIKVEVYERLEAQADQVRHKTDSKLLVKTMTLL